MKRLCPHNSTILMAAMLLVFALSVRNATLHAQDVSTPPTNLDNALPPAATGEQIYQAACATCHAPDGTGSPQSVVGFALPLPNGHDFPDFTDCPTNTVEPFGDWIAVATRGGPVRALDRHMPAFGDALSPEQLEKVVRYVKTLCTDAAWPPGDLNFPRAFFTEKAFPENETVWTTGVTTSGTKGVSNELVYEHRIGARGQYEVKIPIDFQQGGPGTGWTRGLGDVELAIRRTFHANFERGSILAAGAAVVLPTGKESLGLGSGTMVYEPFAMFGQRLWTNGFLQFHTGYEIAADDTKATNEGFLRTAVGYTFAQDQGFGRVWSPMAEVIVAKPKGGSTEWDVVPQMQVSLSKLQHILLSVGVRVPVNEREERKPQFLTYFLWDWFDGGLFQFWR
ncbi:MAG: c-type cytochrome [Vicinamibacterales bacterium]